MAVTNSHYFVPGVSVCMVTIKENHNVPIINALSMYSTLFLINYALCGHLMSTSKIRMWPVKCNFL